MTLPSTTRRRAGTWLSAVTLAVVLSPCLLYGAAYARARAEHRLVHYSGGFIGRPNLLHGIGYSTEELVFTPARWAEELVRGLLDPTW